MASHHHGDFLEKPLAPIVVTALNSKERAARASIEKAEAERRLREAEARLREAIKALNRSHGKDPEGSLYDGRHALCHHGDSCIANAIGSLCQSFLLAYGVRVGIGVLLRAFKLAKRRPHYTFLDLQLLLSEKNLIVREEACRTGLLFGGFAGAFHGIRCLLRRFRNKDTPLNVFIAGAFAGLSVLSLDDPAKRRTFALYLLARVAQCTYNSAKAKDKFHFWGSHWKHGDTLLFSLATAQIMYAYVMRPETLPESYLEFIIKTGPIARPVLKAVRESCRGGPIDIAALSAFVERRTGQAITGLQPNAPIIPCSCVHPESPFCFQHNMRAMRATFKKTFPLYLSLTFVPFVVLNVQKFMQAPMHTFWNALKSAVRSTYFLSAFVGIYQGIICLQRKAVTKDFRFIYWFAGAIASLSAMLEKKGRRSELALYVLPRAADSLWYILINRHLLPNIKHAEVALFCLCMGGLMYYHEHEPDTMAPFLRGLIRRFLNRTGGMDQPPVLSTAYPYFLPLDVPSSAIAIEDGRNHLRLHLNHQHQHQQPPLRDGVVNGEDPLERLQAEAFKGL
ncbi:hypothetical protein SELMODRAFT_165273 [Selaginella moellendorffii]|uniref:Transmembrane protein 135 N-terminal domain-containing protein n=1 Tax=Selaginella moellendorffii TaxID=88036 RepID=D8QTA2_SELML|nr:uncharacterized protein LOC9647124 [Selaginella moellendorffii]EFJ37079.1 hypothetical protein SELMODRAFT_165273 [Selaginella moellendorffii]|eukprot:XP_002961819.1 uncharacterized protein LOC9647124 [Selaginella moellendorffii]